MSNINLLPWRIEDKKKKKSAFLAFLSLALLVTAVLSFAGKLFVDMKIDAQNNRNQFLQRETIIIENRIAEIRDIKKQKHLLERRIKAIKALEKQRNLVTRLFNTLVNVTPRGIYLTEITYSGDRIKTKGLSESNKSLATLVRNIDATDWLSDASISSVVAEVAEPIQASKFSMHFVVSEQLAEDE